MSKPFYITTTLPYVNADPHIGFAFELVMADIVARYKELMGFEVFFNTGTDEHGVKIYRKALEEGKDPQEYVNEYADKFRSLKSLLGLSENIHFIRTTDKKHIRAAEAFWRRCKDADYIEKKPYKAKYCSGCELPKTDSELLNGQCPIHTNLKLEILEEENYFFKFSKFTERLKDFYAVHPDFVVPDFRFNEIKALSERGLQDFSISRLKSKMPWGVPVPGDKDHVMYVWFEALVSYISTLGWPDEMENFTRFWGTNERANAVQFAGKDNIRQQSAMWQAMLMAAGLPNSKQIVIHGFITSEGEKMSKSLGNVIDPIAIVNEYGADALRYYLARHIHPFEDSDFTMEKFKEAYNADLANGIGNLTSRIMKMSEDHMKDTNILMGTNDTNSTNVSLLTSPFFQGGDERGGSSAFPKEFISAFAFYNIERAAEIISETVSLLDRRIQETEPFKLVKTDPEKGKAIIAELVVGLRTVARMLNPFMPATSRKIKEMVQANKMPSGPLFPRK